MFSIAKHEHNVAASRSAMVPKSIADSQIPALIPVACWSVHSGYVVYVVYVVYVGYVGHVVPTVAVTMGADLSLSV